jgi:hypothetical protein
MNAKKILSFSAAFACALFFSACDGDNSVSVTEKIVEGTANASGTSAATDSKNNAPSQATGEKLLVDDFEDGDNQSPLGDYWYMYNDKGSGAESSIESMTADAEGHPKPTATDNGSKNSFNVKFTLKKGGYQYDAYVGWGVHLPTDKDYSKFTAVSYRYKGGSHYIHVELSSITDSDHYSKSMPFTKEWTSAVVEFSKLHQEGWGAAVPFKAEEISAISFQAKGPDTQDSVFIDDIYLLSGTEEAK